MVDIEDSAVSSDIERPSVRQWTLVVYYTVSGRDLLVRVGQDDVVRLDVLGELLVCLGVIDARGKRYDVLKRPDTVAALTERLAFGGSSPGEGFGEPGKHDDLALVVRQLVDLAIGALERKLWCPVADFQFGFGDGGLRWSGCRSLGERRERHRRGRGR